MTKTTILFSKPDAIRRVTLIADYDSEANKTTIGYTVCSEKDNFSRKKGIEIVRENQKKIIEKNGFLYGKTGSIEKSDLLKTVSALGNSAKLRLIRHLERQIAKSKKATARLIKELKRVNEFGKQTEETK